jgi:hypothetical protein
MGPGVGDCGRNGGDEGVVVDVEVVDDDGDIVNAPVTPV